MQILSRPGFLPFPLATLGSLVVCGVGVHLWVVRARSEWLSLGLFDDRGTERGKGTGEAEGEKPTRRARPVGHTRILSSRTPHAMTVRPSFPVFVSCFRFFRRGGMFQDCSVSAAVTHLVSCGGGYAGLPDACMRASLTAAVSWLACLVRHPDICTLPACQNLHTRVNRGWSERGNLTLCENPGKVDRRTIRYNGHTASSTSSQYCLRSARSVLVAPAHG